MDKQERMQKVAALLDGEMRDLREAEQFSAQIQSDPDLKAEYETQRQMKSLLSSLPEHKAPDFMATRVMGEIAARRKLNRRFSIRTWAAAVGGFALSLITMLVFNLMGAGPQLANAPLMASQPTMVEGGQLIPAAGGSIGNQPIYAEQYWQKQIPQDIDPQVRDFLEFTRTAHGYSRMQHAADAVSPDLPQAVMVVDVEGGR
jgi:hypothetical protein